MHIRPACRHEIYEGYKGQRAACPDAVKEAVPRLQRLLDAMAIPYIQVRCTGPKTLHATLQAFEKGVWEGGGEGQASATGCIDCWRRQPARCHAYPSRLCKAPEHG